MHWQLKALVQMGIAALPERLGEPFYYQLQRRLGALRRPDPFDRFEAGAKIARCVQRQNKTLQGQKVLEIGTGWRLNTPIALWLCGADIVTIDLRRFLRTELIEQDLRILTGQAERTRAILESLPLNSERWEILLQASQRPFTLSALPGIEYLAPQDASRLQQYEDAAFFGSFSYTVLEHIPEQALINIFREISRVTDPRGISVHMIDHSDHFSHVDRRLSSIHFLRFTASQWRFWGGNRYAYCNRLRHSDFLQIFQQTGYEFLEIEPLLDDHVLDGLSANRYPLWERFADMEHRDIATHATWLTMKKALS